MTEQAAPWRSTLVEHDGETFYVEEGGDPACPALVLSHGAGGNRSIWFHQMSHFAGAYRVVTWDHRGFGSSTDNAERSGPDVAVGDLLAILDQLGIDQAHHVGQSMGGWTALGVTLGTPERVLSLTLADSLGGIPVSGWLDRPPSLAMPSVVGQHRALGPTFVAENPAGAFLYQTIGAFGRGAGVGIPASVGRQLMSIAHPADALAAITAPVLFIVGSDDEIFPPSWVREAAGHIPGASVEVIDHAGHSPYFERPEIWNALVERFIAGG